LRRFPVIKLKSLCEISGLENKNIKNPRFIAGGTDLLIRIKDHILPDDFTVIDISGLEELKGIEVSDDYIIIRALTTHGEIAKNPALKEHAPSLTEGCHTVGCPQIRNRATVGGNISNASPAGDSLPPLYVLGAEVNLVKGEKKQVGQDR